MRRLVGSLQAEYRKAIIAGSTSPAMKTPMLRMTTGGWTCSRQTHTAMTSCAAMMPHSSQVASCGARPRNCARAIVRSQFLPWPSSRDMSPGGGNGLSPDQYQRLRGSVSGSLKAAAASRYSRPSRRPADESAATGRLAISPNARTASTAAHTTSGTPDVITYGR